MMHPIAVHQCRPVNSSSHITHTRKDVSGADPGRQEHKGGEGSLRFQYRIAARG